MLSANCLLYTSAKDETGEKWLATKGPAGSESYDENGNLRSKRQLRLEPVSYTHLDVYKRQGVVERKISVLPRETLLTY